MSECEHTPLSKILLLFPVLLFLAFREFYSTHSALNEADLTDKGAGVCFEADFSRWAVTAASMSGDIGQDVEGTSEDLCSINTTLSVSVCLSHSIFLLCNPLFSPFPVGGPSARHSPGCGGRVSGEAGAESLQGALRRLHQVSLRLP